MTRGSERQSSRSRGRGRRRAPQQPLFKLDRWDTGALTHAATAIVMLLALLLGGASRDNALQLATVELIALPLLMFAVWRLVMGEKRLDRGAVVFLAILILAPLIQLIPLPPGLWASLPERREVADALAVAGVEPRWRPLTTTPALAYGAWLALIPALAVFLASSFLSAAQRLQLCVGILIVALCGIVLGAVQISGGGQPDLYLYKVTSFGNAVGFFSNRNHQATFLVACIPLSAAAATWILQHWKMPLAILLGALWPLLAVGVLVTQSRAGLVLLPLALLLGLGVLWRSGLLRIKMRPVFVLGSIGLAFAAVVLVGFLVVSGGLASEIGDRLRAGETRELRFEAWPHIAKAALDYGPLGSGLGSFDTIFRSRETLDLLIPTYLNHAHNDFLELWLETGWLGLLAVVAFIGWFLWRAAKVWRQSGSGAAAGQAASAAMLLMLAHSVVDYPLRTVSLAALFALCAAMMLAPVATRTRACRTPDEAAKTASPLADTET